MEEQTRETKTINDQMTNRNQNKRREKKPEKSNNVVVKNEQKL